MATLMRTPKTRCKSLVYGAMVSGALGILLPKVGHAQEPMCDTTYKLLTYGLPRFEYQNATAVVGRKWCINYFAVAGCVVSKELVDSVRTENQRVTADIVSRYGADWEVRFDADVEREFAREQEIVAKIEALPAIQERQKELKAEGNGLHYWVTPVEGGDEVLVRGYAPWEGKTEWLVLYEFRVDGMTGTVTLASDEPRRE